jgi:predicted Zn-dependent protease
VRSIALTAALLLACGEPTLPSRQAAYGFADGFGEVFRWPNDRIPVRFYADTRGAMPDLVARAIAVWEDQFLYGEFDGVLTQDSAAADVIVVWSGTVPPDVPPDPGAPVNACTGFTRLVINSATNALDSAIVITAQSLAGSATDAQRAACFVRVVTHEVGHSLGLLDHSAQAGDLMAAQPVVDTPTARDRVTVEVLYHTPPTIGPPP